MFAFKLALLVTSLKVKYSFDFGAQEQGKSGLFKYEQKDIENDSLFLNKVYTTCKLYNSEDSAQAVIDHCLRSLKDRHMSDVLV